ncbi:MAG TPA: hypothetical protein PKI32_04895 [Opitutales bacterium]|nr:hypothetical protein [Opitutales bacterium]
MLNADAPIPRELLDIVSRELARGENIEWSAMPRPRFFTKTSTGAFLFAIPWTAFAVFWTVGASGALGTGGVSGGSVVFALFGVPFILVGLGMLSTPLWVRWHDRKTIYVITDRRALTFVGGRSITVRSFTPDKLGDIFRREKSDGSGDVVFGMDYGVDTEGKSRVGELGFFNIPNVRAVDEKLQKLAAKASQPVSEGLES